MCVCDCVECLCVECVWTPCGLGSFCRCSKRQLLRWTLIMRLQRLCFFASFWIFCFLLYALLLHFIFFAAFYCISCERVGYALHSILTRKGRFVLLLSLRGSCLRSADDASDAHALAPAPPTAPVTPRWACSARSSPATTHPWRILQAKKR